MLTVTLDMHFTALLPWLELSKQRTGAFRREVHNDSDVEGEISANM